MAWRPSGTDTSRLTTKSGDDRFVEQRVQNSIIADVMGLGIGATSPDWAIRTAIADELSRDGMRTEQVIALIRPLVAGAVSAARVVDAPPLPTSKSIMQAILAHADRRQQSFLGLVERTCCELAEAFSPTKADIGSVAQGAGEGASVGAARWKVDAAHAQAEVARQFSKMRHRTTSERN